MPPPTPTGVQQRRPVWCEEVDAARVMRQAPVVDGG